MLGRNESLSDIAAKNVPSLTLSSYNDSATNFVHQDAAVWRRHLLAVVTGNSTSYSNLSSVDDNASVSSVIGDELNCSVSTVGKSYPDDLFSDTQLYRGAVALHAVGTVYMLMCGQTDTHTHAVPTALPGSLQLTTLHVTLAPPICYCPDIQTHTAPTALHRSCLLYTSDAADE